MPAGKNSNLPQRRRRKIEGSKDNWASMGNRGGGRTRNSPFRDLLNRATGGAKVKNVKPKRANKGPHIWKQGGKDVGVSGGFAKSMRGMDTDGGAGTPEVGPDRNFRKNPKWSKK